MDPTFVSFETQAELSTHMWELALLALPMTFIIISAGIDLSVGSMLALSAVAFGMAFERGAPVGAAAAIALAVGAAAGFLNGAATAYLRVHPLIVTLATLAAYRGIAEGVSLGRPISGFPEEFLRLGSGRIAGLPLPAILFAALAALAAVVLARTPFGRGVYAIGSNETAARFSGIPVARAKLLMYSLSGLFAGMSALILCARRNTAKADLGLGLELDVITAVVLGGASIFGGRGHVLGTLLGVLIIHETRELVSWRWQRDELNLIVIGALLIASVVLHRALSSRSGRESS